MTAERPWLATAMRMKTMKAPAIARTILWVGLIAGAAACGEEAERTSDVLPSVSAAEVVSIDLEEEIRASGDLRARLHTVIAAEVAGRVTNLRIDEGGAATTGAIVLELDPDRRELDVDAARARLAQARANRVKERRQADRVRRLHSENVASAQQLEEAETALLLAKSAVEVEEAEVGVAERALADASVSAPFSGLVSRRMVQLGEFVQPGTPLFELVALDPLEAVFSLTELDTERVRVGQKVEIRVSAFEGRVFEGVIIFVAPTVDPATRTLRIKAEVDNAHALLRPGLFARVHLGIDGRDDVLMVPEESLTQRAGGAFLYRIDAEDRVTRIDVQTGARTAGLVEVRGPLSAGDRVVRRGHGGLADGMVVVVRGMERRMLDTAGGLQDGAES